MFKTNEGDKSVRYYRGGRTKLVNGQLYSISGGHYVMENFYDYWEEIDGILSSTPISEQEALDWYLSVYQEYGKEEFYTFYDDESEIKEDK